MDYGEVAACKLVALHAARRARVRNVHAHARHIVRARREVHEKNAVYWDIFGTDTEDEE